MENKTFQGFILTANHNDFNGKHTLNFHGVSDFGPFEIIITNNKPVFFVEKDADLNFLHSSVERKALGLKSFAGRAIDGLYFKTQNDLLSTRDALKDRGIRSYEADIRPAERFLMERFINCSVMIIGECKLENGVMKLYDPKIKPSQFRPKLSQLSLDIETSFGNDLYSIAFQFRKGEEEIRRIFMVGESREDRDNNLEIYPSEKEVLIAFYNAFHEVDPDLIIGWHVIGFDLVFLDRKFKQYDLKFNLGRAKTKLRLNEGSNGGHFASLNGRVIVDGPPALRSAFYSFENFRLGTVASELLGTTKEIEALGSEKVEEIGRRFREDKDGLAKYNILDCTLVTDIYDKTGLIDLLITRCMIAGLLPDRIAMSTAAFDHFLLPLVHRKGYVASNVLDIEREAQAAGGYVLEPEVGFHDNVVVFDFKSLYPSIIKTFKIDPLSRLLAGKNPLTTPSGIQFSRTEHLLPDFIDVLFVKRDIAKQNNDKHLSQAIKILMNSFYGVMGSPGSRFYHSDLPTAITGTGKWILQAAIQYLQTNEYDVLYGDTDSVFVKLKDHEVMRYQENSEKLLVEVNEYLTTRLKKEFSVDSELELEFDKYYKKFFLPAARGGKGGAKKRYAGLLVGLNSTDLQFAGMEFVRSDWTKLAKNFQYQLFERIFNEENYENFIREYVDKVKTGEFDTDLIYKKRLTKKVSEYTKNIPPHVRAAKLLMESKGVDERLKEIEYIWTRSGPVPVQFEPDDIDYQHYIEKQIKPLADSVLLMFDTSFDDIVIGDQLSLF
jgi:DNA polymerase-2